MRNKKLFKVIISIFLLVLIIVIITSGIWIYIFFNNRLVKIEKDLNNNLSNSKLLKKQVNDLSEAYAKLKERPTEIIRREVIKQKSQDEMLTDAVSKVAPAVVSIVVTKDVPQLEVIYINPFGDDPFFEDFGVRIPKYRQKGTTEQKIGAGTGFIVNSNGYIITNRHVIDEQDANYTVLLNNGEQKSAKILYIDQDIDIAILKIEGNNYSVIKLGNSNELKLGQSVFAVGNALGEYNNSVSIGIISGLNRALEAFGAHSTEKLQGVIQTDAAINPGNSGGPLVNLAGEVIGINVAMASAENIGFAIPIDAVKSIIDSHVK